MDKKRRNEKLHKYESPKAMRLESMDNGVGGSPNCTDTGGQFNIAICSDGNAATSACSYGYLPGICNENGQSYSS